MDMYKQISELFEECFSDTIQYEINIRDYYYQVVYSGIDNFSPKVSHIPVGTDLQKQFIEELSKNTTRDKGDAFSNLLIKYEV